MNKGILQFSIIVFLLAFFTSVVRADVSAPLGLEDTDTLPKNIRNPRFLMVFTQVESKFGSDGSVEPLGKPLNKTVSWNDIIGSRSTEQEKNLVKSVLNSIGINDYSQSPGKATGEVNTAARVLAPVFAYGITDTWTMAAAVPIYNVDVNADTGFIKSAQGQAFIKASEGDPSQSEFAARALNDAINYKLKGWGYEEIKSKEVSAIGDIKLVSKYRFYDDGQNKVLLKNELTTPTGKASNPDAALDVPTGDGQWDLGAGINYDRVFKEISNNLSTAVFGSYTFQAADTLTMRIPTEAGSSLSPDKELVNRDLGDVVTLGLGANYTFPEFGLTLGGGYVYQHQATTRFSGNKFERRRYEFLQDLEPEQTLHSMVASLGFSSVDFYRSGKFVYPFQASITYSHPLSGVNASTADAVAAELVMFF